MNKQLKEKQARLWRDEQIETLNNLCGEPSNPLHPDTDKLYDIGLHVPSHIIESSLMEISRRIAIKNQIPGDIKHRDHINKLYLRIIGQKCNRFGIPNSIMLEEYPSKPTENNTDNQ